MPKVINVRNNKGPCVYVGRPEQNGYPLHFGNPFLMGSESKRDAVCDRFDEWLFNNHYGVEIKRREWIHKNMILLQGRDLSCYCAPKRCHGDTLLELAAAYRPVFRVIVAGGHDFSDYQMLEQRLDRILGKKADECQIVVLSGLAHGADALGVGYAGKRGYRIAQFPAQGKDAEMIRDAAMRNYADAAVVFWNGESSDISEMVEGCKRDNIPLRVISYRK